jgi:cell division septation protein DedD
VKAVRYKAGYRKGDPDRRSYAFFVVGALVVIAVAFFIGLQVGRVVEKNAAKERLAAAATSGTAAQEPAPDIGKEISAYSDEAVRIPVVPPPNAGEDLRKAEANATFPDSLTRKDASPPPLVKPKEKAPPAAARPGKFVLQAGALKSKDAAEGLRGRIERAGYRANVSRTVTKNRTELFRVRIGPFRTREEANKAMKAIGSGLKIDVILLHG